MTRLLLLLIVFGAATHPLRAQESPTTASTPPTAAGTYRVDIHSPAPRGTWTALISIKPVPGGYEGTFRDPDGPGTYPVASVAVKGDSITVIMAGEATGSVFYLTARNDSLVGIMTSVTHGDTRVNGVRLSR